MTTITATNARSNLFQVLKRILLHHLPLRISSKEGTVVVLPEDDYESLTETAELLSVPGFKESIDNADNDIARGDVLTMDDVFGSA